MNRDLLLSIPDSLATADLGGESVLLDAASGTYFGLNDVGTRIFELAREPKTVAQIEEVLLTEYNVEPSRLRLDIEMFVTQLVERGLLNAR